MRNLYPEPVSWDLMFNAWVQNRAELGVVGLDQEVDDIRAELQTLLERVQQLPVDPEFAAREPNDLTAIRALRPAG